MTVGPTYPNAAVPRPPRAPWRVAVGVLLLVAVPVLALLSLIATFGALAVHAEARLSATVTGTVTDVTTTTTTTTTCPVGGQCTTTTATLCHPSAEWTVAGTTYRWRNGQDGHSTSYPQPCPFVKGAPVAVRYDPNRPGDGNPYAASERDPSAPGTVNGTAFTVVAGIGWTLTAAAAVGAFAALKPPRRP